MYPSILGLPTPFWFWVGAAVFGMADGMSLARRGGFPLHRAVAALLILSVAILVGSKLLYAAEQALAPLGAPRRLDGATVSGLLQDGFRIPGGLLLAAAILPIVCRMLRLPALRFADATAPALGTAILFIRTGCLLAGCCFGRIVPWPFGVRFPVGSVVHAWHVGAGVIGPMGPYSAPVYPLPLWFALIGLGLRLAGGRWQSRKRFDGEVVAKFSLAFYGTTFLLEFFRGYWLPINVLLTAAAAAVGALTVLLLPRLAARREGTPDLRSAPGASAGP